MSAIFSTVGNFVNRIGEMEGFNTPQKQLREKNADLLEHAILGIQANTSLSPQEKTFQIGEARKQLQNLYEPHEGQQLFARLGRLFGGKGQTASTPPVADTSTNTDPGLVASSSSEVTNRLGIPNLSTPKPPTPVLRPGMTIDDVLAAGSKQAPPARIVSDKPFQEADGNWYVMTQKADGTFAPQLQPGYTEKSAATKHLEDLQGYVDKGLIKPEDVSSSLRISLGLDAKAGKEKQAKVDRKDGVTILTDEDGTQYTDLSQIPKDRKDLLGMYTTAEKKFSKSEDDREIAKTKASAEHMAAAFQNALAASDYKLAQRDINKADLDYQASIDRQKTMDENLKDIQKGYRDGKVNQQAMLSLVANHIGMTLGAQKGARITRAVWDEAIQSAPWLSRVGAQWSPEGYLTGVTVTEDQAKQMVDLAHQKVGVLNDHVGRLKDQYADALGVKKGKGGTPKPADLNNALDEIFGPGKK